MTDKIIQSFDIWTEAQGLKSKGRVKSVDNISLEGIARLRELILELAVSGKLVPQDQNDEPASELLKKIAKEKERLVKEGKIKKQEKLHEIGEDEIPFDIHKNWSWVRLQNIVTVLGDGLHGTPAYTPDEKYYFINGNNLSNGKIEIKPDTKTVSKEEMLKYKKELNLRSVLISINGTLGNVAFYNGEEIMLGKSACYFNLLDNIFKYYIKLIIESPYFKVYALHNSTGSTIKNLGLKAMNELPIPLPPLAEQHRIVAKVDELMALCDKLETQQFNNLKTHETLVKTLLETLTQAANADELQTAWARLSIHFDTLFCTENSIDQLKQTILQLAVMGKLVKQNPNDLPANPQGKFFVYVIECSNGSWYKGFTRDIKKRWNEHLSGKGAEHTKKYPPVKLIHWEEFNNEKEAINREKFLKSGAGRAWLKLNEKQGTLRQAGEPASELLKKIAKEKEKLVKEGKIKKQEKLPEIGDDEKPFGLPEGWEFVRLGDITTKIGSGSTPRGGDSAYTDSGIIFIRSQNVYNEGLHLDDVAYIPEATNEKMSNTIVFPKDILLNITGGSLGRSTIFPEELKIANVSQHVTIIRPTELETRFFLHLCILSPYIQSLIWGRQVGMAREGLSKKVLEQFEIPIPPLAEQLRIITKVEELFTLCDTLKEKLIKSQEIKGLLAKAVVEGAVG